MNPHKSEPIISANHEIFQIRCTPLAKVIKFQLSNKNAQWTTIVEKPCHHFGGFCDRLVSSSDVMLGKKVQQVNC